MTECVSKRILNSPHTLYYVYNYKLCLKTFKKREANYDSRLDQLTFYKVNTGKEGK